MEWARIRQSLRCLGAQLRRFCCGPEVPPAGVDGIPRESREAHHRIAGTAMKMKSVARHIDNEANDILAMLARDIRKTGHNGC